MLHGRAFILDLGDDWSGDKVDDMQRMSEGEDDEIDRETSSESCQDSDVDGSEFPGCEGSVDLFNML